MSRLENNPESAEETASRDILALFEEQTFFSRFRRMFSGLRAPRGSGAYKNARTELQRLLAPAAALLVPLAIALWLMVIEIGGSPVERQFSTEIVEMDSVEALDRIDDILEPPQEFEPLSTDITVDTPDIAPPSPTPDAPVSPRQETFSDVAMVRSPIILRGLFSSRTDAGRAEGLRRHAGRHGDATEAAVIRALEWLKANQLEDGSWRGAGAARSKTAMTGLGLLTFLAHGETPGSERYGPTVKKAIQFLIEIDQKPDGTFRNTEGGFRGGVYAHGIAGYALSEAYALTQIPMVRSAMEKAIEHMVKGQRPDGGYDYMFAHEDGQRHRCTSVAGWMAQAMKAANMAGARVSGLEDAMKRAAEGFKKNYVSREAHFMYNSKTGEIRHSMTPIGTLCLQLLGHAGSSEARGALASMAGWIPSWTNPDMSHGILEPLYVWYYATQAFFHQGGAGWTRWNDRFAPVIVENQNDDGSWTWPHGRASEYGPVYATTLSALSLMVYYRYLPTYQTPDVIDEGMGAEDTDDIDIVVDF